MTRALNRLSCTLLPFALRHRDAGDLLSWIGRFSLRLSELLRRWAQFVTRRS